MNTSLRTTVRRLDTAIAVSVLLALSSLATGRAGDSLVGKVVEVKGPDLITLDYGAGTQDVRIAGIEVDSHPDRTRAAESGLSDLVLGKSVRLRFDGYLPSGEMSGRIWVGGIGKPEEPVKDVGVELVREGVVRSAKQYREYKYGEMQRAEAEARQNKRGLWR